MTSVGPARCSIRHVMTQVVLKQVWIFTCVSRTVLHTDVISRLFSEQSLPIPAGDSAEFMGHEPDPHHFAMHLFGTVKWMRHCKHLPLNVFQFQGTKSGASPTMQGLSMIARLFVFTARDQIRMPRVQHLRYVSFAKTKRSSQLYLLLQATAQRCRDRMKGGS